MSSKRDSPLFLFAHLRRRDGRIFSHDKKREVEVSQKRWNEGLD